MISSLLQSSKSKLFGAQNLFLSRFCSTDAPKVKSPPTSFTYPVLSIKTGEPVGTVELRRSLFGVPVRKDILHRIIVWKLASTRAGTGCAKNRGEMAGRKGKMGKQKGSGRARVGNRRTPIRKGGGTAFPPKPRDFSYTLNKKVRRLALKCALSSKFAQNKLVIVDNFDLESFKTRPFGKMVEQRGWGNSVFVDTPNISTNMFYASRNIPGLLFYEQKKANVHDILRKNMLILHKDTLEYFHERAEGLLPSLPGRNWRRRQLRKRRLAQKLAQRARSAEDLQARREKEAGQQEAEAV